MKVQVKLFAAMKQQAGREVVDVQLDEPATVGQLRRALAEQHPSLAPFASHVFIAVAREYADDQTPLQSDSELACIPPVSGG